jgi:hypothetical protein
MTNWRRYVKKASSGFVEGPQRSGQGCLQSDRCRWLPNGSRLSCGALKNDSFHICARRQLQARVRPRLPVAGRTTYQVPPRARL